MGADMKSIYLSGPISGLHYDEAARGWRQDAGHILEDAGAIVLDPTKLETENEKGGAIDPLGDQDSAMLNWKSITTKDRFYVQQADLMILNLLGAQRVSIGSMIELGWADLLRKPVVLIMEPEFNMHEHAMVREMAGFRAHTLEQGLMIAMTLLQLTPTSSA